MNKVILTSAFALMATSAFAADLNICVEGAYPPFSETAEDGSVVGFDIDIANALCDEMGKSCEMVKTDWDGIIPALLEKKCDAIIASMSITPERQEVIAFSSKYYSSPNMFVAKEGTMLEDVNGLKVGVQRGTIHQDFMEKVYPDAELMLYGTQDEVFLDLEAGRIDATVGDAIQNDEGFLKTDAGEGYAFIEDADVTDVEIHGEGAGVGVRQEDQALADEFTAAIAAIRESGVYKEINDQYFTVDIYGKDLEM